MHDSFKKFFWAAAFIGLIAACATHLRVGELELETHTQGVETSE